VNKSNHGGNRLGAGRPKGAENKITRTIKEHFKDAFEELGGSEGLVKWAKKSDENLGMFYRMCTKMIPTPDKEKEIVNENTTIIVRWKGQEYSSKKKEENQTGDIKQIN